MRTIHHMCINIEGLLRNMKGKKITFFDDEGNAMTEKRARAELARLQGLGHKLMGPACCEGFDPFGGGCPGHEVKEEEPV